MTLAPSDVNLTDLHARHKELLEQEPHLRIREAAKRLGVSEAALVAADPANCRLNTKATAVLQRLTEVGEVMGLTRNDHAVIEKTGHYEGWHAHPHAAMFVGPEIDMRCFVGQWKHCYSVAGKRPSIQFFDKHGQAIHKVFALKNTNQDAWRAIVNSFANDDDDDNTVSFEEVSAPAPLTDATSIDKEALIKAWGELEDVHHFHSLLRKFKLDRLTATRLVEDAYSRQLPNLAVVDCLERSAAENIPLLIFVGNDANIQIHGGPIERTAWRDQWFNVLDPRFNLHLATEGIAESWLTTKPVKNGTVTAVECYDAHGEVILSIFGHRKEKQGERDDWRALGSVLGLESK